MRPAVLGRSASRSRIALANQRTTGIRGPRAFGIGYRRSVGTLISARPSARAPRRPYGESRGRPNVRSVPDAGDGDRAEAHSSTLVKFGRMRTITSSRLLLRPWHDDDADFLLDLESRWEVVRFLGAHPATMNTRADALASIARRRAIDHPIHGIWAIATAADGRLLGNLLLKPIPLLAARPGRLGADRRPTAGLLPGRVRPHRKDRHQSRHMARTRRTRRARHGSAEPLVDVGRRFGLV